MFTERDFIVRIQGQKEVEYIRSSRNIANGQLVLTKDSSFKVFVWNIFKQKKTNCLNVLDSYIQKMDLLLLQEAQANQPLVNLLAKHAINADLVPAYEFNHVYTGVMTIARCPPVSFLTFKEKEPYIRVPKSALVSYYAIENYHSMLLVANVHAINFTFGIKVYSQQIRELLFQLKHHKGPIILAGDFNAWNQSRVDLLLSLIRADSFQEVNFIEDKRKMFLGRPLDFIFYKGLKLEESTIIDTDTSDHNPLSVKFKLDSYPLH